jgi:predicted branched-subunit amino acid permease
MKAAMPVWIAFVPSSVALGMAAQAHGLTLQEILLMSALVYSGPAQFAVLAPLSENQSAFQVLVTGFLMNLRFLTMSMALAPFFRGVKRSVLILSSQVISASSFVLPYLQFQHERKSVSANCSETKEASGHRHLSFFLGVGATSFLVWVIGTGVGYGAALGFPPGFEEPLKFILPGYFAGLLAVETRGRTVALVCLASLFAAVPGALVSPGWGWLATATAVATIGWRAEEWNSRAAKLS